MVAFAFYLLLKVQMKPLCYLHAVCFSYCCHRTQGVVALYCSHICHQALLLVVAHPRPNVNGPQIHCDNLSPWTAMLAIKKTTTKKTSWFLL